MIWTLAAFSVLGGGLSLAGVMWARPHVSQWRAMRRFRKRLRQLELVVLVWEASVDTDDIRRERRPIRRRDDRYNNPT